MISLSRRITGGSLALTAAVVGVAVVLIWTVARWQAVRRLDADLAEHAQRMSFFADRPEPPPPEPEDLLRGPEPPPPPPLQAGTGWIFVEVVDHGGRSVFRSPSLSRPEVTLIPALTVAPAGAPRWAVVDGRPVRAMRVPLGTAMGYVARDAASALAELHRLAWTLAGVWATASLLALLAAWWLRRAVVAPLDRLAAGIRAIDPERLGGRIEVDAPREVAETVLLLNGLLVRLAAVVAREKGTLASIAHELRSPISALRTTLEVAALDPAAAAGDRALAARCLPTVVAMHAMVANLLALARIEAGQERVDLREADLDALVEAAWAGLAPMAEGRRQRLVRTGRAGLVRTCPDKARMVVANLLDNAICHAPEGSAILLTLSQSGGRARLRVENPVAGAMPDLAHAFEPFWRGDAARSAPQHCGLGLALAKRLAGLLAADLRVEAGDQRFIACFELPAVP